MMLVRTAIWLSAMLQTSTGESQFVTRAPPIQLAVTREALGLGRLIFS